MIIVIQKITLNSQSISEPCAEWFVGSHQSAQVAGAASAACGPASSPSSKTAATEARRIGCTRLGDGEPFTNPLSFDLPLRAAPTLPGSARGPKNCPPSGDGSKRGGWLFTTHP